MDGGQADDSEFLERALIARPRVRALAMLAAIVLVVGCTSRAPLPSGAIAVRTDDGLMNASSQTPRILCSGGATVPPPPVGILAGDASDVAWPVWVLAADGRRTYVIWPRGFSVRFDPRATLLDETGNPILYEGNPISMGAFADTSLGTRELPYTAGYFETGLARVPHCYYRD